MIQHLGIRGSHIGPARQFYDSVFAALGGTMVHQVLAHRTGGRIVLGYGRDCPQFWLNSDASDSEAQYVVLTARNRAEVVVFPAAELAAGGRDNGSPRLRPLYHANYFCALVLDLDGNNIEAVCHGLE